MAYTIEKLRELEDFLSWDGPLWENRSASLVETVSFVIDTIHNNYDPESIRLVLLDGATSRQEGYKSYSTDYSNHPLFDLYHILYDDLTEIPRYVNSECAFLIRWRFEHVPEENRLKELLSPS